MIGNDRRVRHDAVVVALMKRCTRVASARRSRRALRELCMVGLPRIGAKNIRGPIKAVAGTMPLIRSALGDHLDLRADGPVEVGSLTESINSEFFDAFDRGWHDT